MTTMTSVAGDATGESGRSRWAGWLTGPAGWPRWERPATIMLPAAAAYCTVRSVDAPGERWWSASTGWLAGAGEQWAAAAVGAQDVSALELSTGKSLLAIGGFSGRDSFPTLPQFQQDVADHRIGYFLVRQREQDENGPAEETGPTGHGGKGDRPEGGNLPGGSASGDDGRHPGRLSPRPQLGQFTGTETSPRQYCCFVLPSIHEYNGVSRGSVRAPLRRDLARSLAHVFRTART